MKELEVLVVDDEPQLRELIGQYLEAEGFTVRTASDGVEALDQVAVKEPDVILLDLMLPRLSGVEVLRSLREQGSTVPILVLSARGEEPERVAGLELGADDYVPKPASAREIAARVRAVMRRTKPAAEATYEFSDVTVDTRTRRVERSGVQLEVRPKEFDLLLFMMTRAGEVLSRNQILSEVWGSSPQWQDPSTVTVHIRRLRKLIEADPANPNHLVTVYGVGYRFDL